jgi:voltage-gated potassium channel
MGIKQIIEDNSTPHGRIFDLTIQLLIVTSLVCFSIDTLPNIPDGTQRILGILEATTVSIFSLEYLLRLFVSDGKLRFIFSFYGIIDLLAILPFYLSTGMDLRSLRSFRLLRLFRAFKLLRYSQALDRFRRAFILIREELVLFSITALLLLFISASGIYFFENKAQPEAFSSIFSSLWWSVTTLTTVGYGDMYPVTVGGRLFTFVVLMIGLGVVAVPTGLFASALSKTRDDL